MSLLSGLISYWKLDEPSNGSGAVQRTDLHGGNHLADNNTVTGGVGKINNAAQFTATNSEYLARSSTALHPGTNDYAFSMWFYFEAITAAFNNLVGCGASADFLETAKGFQFGHLGNGSMFFRHGDGSSASRIALTTGNGVISATTWYHLVVNFDRDANMQPFLNGTSIGSLSIAAQPGNVNPSADFRLGALSANGGGIAYYHNGMIDECGMWHRTLSGAEIARLFAAGRGMGYPFQSPWHHNRQLSG